MAKEFYTEKDIEDLVKRGVLSLEINENVYLTDLAYEMANRLGMKLVQPNSQPPSAPVRPYVSKAQPAATSSCACSPSVHLPKDADLRQRIKSAVTAKLGGQVDSALLDRIIDRVLNNTGVK